VRSAGDAREEEVALEEHLTMTPIGHAVVDEEPDDHLLARGRTEGDVLGDHQVPATMARDAVLGARAVAARVAEPVTATEVARVIGGGRGQAARGREPGQAAGSAPQHRDRLVDRGDALAGGDRGLAGALDEVAAHASAQLDELRRVRDRILPEEVHLAEHVGLERAPVDVDGRVDRGVVGLGRAPVPTYIGVGITRGGALALDRVVSPVAAIGASVGAGPGRGRAAGEEDGDEDDGDPRSTTHVRLRADDTRRCRSAFDSFRGGGRAPPGVWC